MTDNEALQRCQELAEQARSAGEAPVGCVITLAGTLIAEARESVRALSDPTAHAEILAVRAACTTRKTLTLPGAVLYSNVEPCHMCAYAIREAGLNRVVFQRPVGPIGGMSPTESLLQKYSEEWGKPPTIQILE